MAPWLSAPHTSSGTSCMPSTLCAISLRRTMNPTCGPLPCVMARSQPAVTMSASWSAVSRSASIWSSTVMWFLSRMSELPPMATTAMRRPFMHASRREPPK